MLNVIWDFCDNSGLTNTIRIVGIFRRYKMFVVFADQASTTNIYTHEFNIACMHVCIVSFHLSIKLYIKHGHDTNFS